MPNLVYNESATNNHLTRMKDLLQTAQTVLLISGWAKKEGIAALEASLAAAIIRGARVMVLSNKRIENKSAMTEKGAVSILKSSGGAHHSFHSPYLHTKLHYFEADGRYVALIGSANLTVGALTTNEELSSEEAGVIGDEHHQRILRYLTHLRDRIVSKGSAPDWVMALPEAISRSAT